MRQAVPFHAAQCRWDHKMEKGQTIGLFMAIGNAITGALLVWFHKPIGSSGARLGKKWQLDKLVYAKLYEESNSRKFVLAIGIYLIVWGVIAFFLIPAMIGANP
jgi:hypothetical protein